MKTPRWWQGSGLASTLLLPAAWLYGKTRRSSAGAGQSAGVRVICVGNVVAGGAGKTPVALALGELLKHRHPFALTRGYGGALAGPLRVDPAQHGFADIGDEALLLARAMPTIVSRDRPAGARQAQSQGAGLIVMDDGFQNPSLAKDISLLVIDGAYGFGNRRLLPAGPLREPVESALARTDAVIVIGEPSAPGLAVWLAGLSLPVFPAALAPQAAPPCARYLAFAGIGQPAKFFATLRALDLPLIDMRAFPDHHPYRNSELEALLQQAQREQARLITTRKDFVRLPLSFQPQVDVLDVELAFADRAAVQQWLEARLDG